MSVYLFAITLGTSGINLAVTRIISEEIACSNNFKIKNIMKKCISITLITSISTSIILWLNADTIIKIFLHSKVNKSIIYLISLAIPLISMSSAISGYFAGVRRIYKNATGQFIEHTFKVIISAYLINLLLPNGLDYACFALILGDLLSEFVSFIYIYIVYAYDKNKHFKNQKDLNISISNKSDTIKILRISIPVAMTSYIRSGLTTLKQLIIPSSLEKSGSSCKEALANYGIINGLAMPVITFPDILVKSFSSMLIPEFARYHAKEDYKKAKTMTNILMSLLLFVSGIISCCLFIFSDNVSQCIYKNTSSSIYIKMLAPLAIFIYIDTVVDSVLRGLDAQVGVMIINILDLIISVGFIFFAVPYLGINGYIISIYLSEILNFIISLYLLIKTLYFKQK